MKYIMIVLCLFLVGCGELDAGLTGRVKTYTLDDGTRCAIYIAPYKGGISCDWGNKL